MLIIVFHSSPCKCVQADYESKSSAKRRKLSPQPPRPRSVSPITTVSPSGRHNKGKKATGSKRSRPIAETEEEKKGGGGGGIGDIFKSIDISSLMGSIQKVKEQTGTNSLAGHKNASTAAAGHKNASTAAAEDDADELKVREYFQAAVAYMYMYADSFLGGKLCNLQVGIYIYI